MELQGREGCPVWVCIRSSVLLGKCVDIHCERLPLVSAAEGVIDVSKGNTPNQV